MKKELSMDTWTDEHISKTAELIHKAKSNRPSHVKVLDHIIPWISLLLIIIGNFAVTVALIPFLMALNQVPLYLMLILIGGAFGFFLELIIGHIQHLEKKHHHALTAVLLFIIVLINVSFIVKFSNSIVQFFPIQNIEHNPWIIASVYSLSFLAPYFFYQVIKKKD